MNVAGGAVSAQQVIRTSHRQTTMRGDPAFDAAAMSIQQQQPSTKGVQSLSRAFEHAAASSSSYMSQSRNLQQSITGKVGNMRTVEIQRQPEIQFKDHFSPNTTTYTTPAMSSHQTKAGSSGSAHYFQQQQQQQCGTVISERSSSGNYYNTGKPDPSSFDPYYTHPNQNKAGPVSRSDSMHFHVPGSSAFDMSAMQHVQSPGGQYEQCQIIDLDDSNYSVRFVPKQMGLHSVSVKHKGIDIPGSPFEFMVGPVPGGGAAKIQAYGAGLYSALVNEISRFEILTKDAGAGSLSVAIEGPTKADIDFQDKKDGTCSISYVCADPGQYKVSIKFDDEHVPGSPFMATVLDSGTSAGATNVFPQMRLTHGLDQGQLNRPMTFTLDMASGRSKSHLLDAYVVSPSGARESCTLSHCSMDGTANSYSIKFTPSQSGLHWVHVLYAGRELPDSPFQVHVKGNVCDPRKVFASGQGLYGGQVNDLSEFFIDTSQAGAGALAVTVDGPSKVHIECDEVDNGYRASFVPTLPGQYLISVKFADVHVSGSPFNCRISGGPGGYMQHSRPLYSSVSSYQSGHGDVDQSNTMIRLDLSTTNPTIKSSNDDLTSEGVVAYGSGISQAFIGEDTHFTIDTRNAKVNPSMLSVSIQGPRKPNRDIQVKRLGDNLYDISYTCAYQGTYQISVKWADRHIDGSPFEVNVC
ncbi:hypothetical protein ACOME3_008581 [Neoechinorhynchus agilis]